MPWTVIAATGDAGQLELLLEAGAEALKVLDPQALTRPRIAMSVEDAKRQLQDAADPLATLLIIAASLPEQQSSPDAVSFPGFELVKVLQEQVPPPACILISEAECIVHYRAALSMQRCQWLPVDARTNYVEQCVQLARRLSAGAEASRSDRIETHAPTIPRRSRVLHPRPSGALPRNPTR